MIQTRDSPSGTKGSERQQTTVRDNEASEPRAEYNKAISAATQPPLLPDTLRASRKESSPKRGHGTRPIKGQTARMVLADLSHAEGARA